MEFLQVSWIPWTSQSNVLWISTHITTPSMKNHQWRLQNTLYRSWISSLWGHKYWNARFSKLWSFVFPFIRKHNPVLFAFDARFTKQWGCWARKLAKVYTAHHVLKGMDTLQVQMAKVVVPKLKSVIFHWRLDQVGHFHFMHLHKINSRGVIAITIPLQDLIIYSFTLNWTFKPFDTNLLTGRKYTCNLGTWNISLIQIWLVCLSKLRPR